MGVARRGGAINTQTCERRFDHSAEITRVWGYGGVLRHQSHGGGEGLILEPYICFFCVDVTSCKDATKARAGTSCSMFHQVMDGRMDG